MLSKNVPYYMAAFVAVLAGAAMCFFTFARYAPDMATQPALSEDDTLWVAPSLAGLTENNMGSQIKYGYQLISNTASYLGPKGSVAMLSNGMNCQNCHLDAGTRLHANSFATVAATYPKYRERSGMVESIAFRINDCMQRSLNGKQLDSTGKEMQAMIAYIKWVGKDVSRSRLPKGTGNPEIVFLPRAANMGNGKIIYNGKCAGCHSADGQGLAAIDGSCYIYPPLWGNNSYNTSAGLYRLGKLAGFVKYNMPYTIIQAKPVLTDEEAWDVAAFITAQNRPVKRFANDWKNIAAKPADYPFGPYADTFSERQHKYGPFDEIQKARQAAGDLPATNTKH